MGDVPFVCPACQSISVPPESYDSSEELLARIVEAFEAELGAGRDPDIESLCERYQDLADQLRKILPLCRDLARLAESPEPEPAVPEHVGPYQVGDRIGKGGMGVVHEGWDERMDRRVALKLLPPDPLRGPGRRRRFAREVRAMARIHHPNVLAVHDVGVKDGWAWLAMDRMQGSLAEHLDPPASNDERNRRLAWIFEASEALGHLHQRGVLHRDIKPSNLLLDERDRVHLGDMGLAWMEGESHLTRTGAVLGTYTYASPEQLAGAKTDEKSDQYSLAATAWHLLSGHAPSREFDEGGSRISPRIRRVLAKALSTDPERRWPDLERFDTALRAASPEKASPRIPPWAAIAAAILVLAWGAWIWIPPPSASTRAASALPASVREPTDGSLRFVVMLDPSSFARAPALAWLRAQGSTFHDLLDAPLQTRSVAKTVIAGRPYEVRLEQEEAIQTIQLREGERTVLEAPLPPPPREHGSPHWSLSSLQPDADGDGHPETVVNNGSVVGLVSWDPSSLGRAELGWRREVESRFGHGSPTVVDWDEDGRREILVGDTGKDARGLHRQPRVHVLDLETGERGSVWDLPQPIHSTPQILSDSSDGVRAAYLDTAMPEDLTQASLWRFEPGRRYGAKVMVPGQGRFTWPVFVDVEGDGRDELIVGRRYSELAGNFGAIYCLDPDEDHQVVWFQETRGWLTVYPVVTQQDEDPAPEVCFHANEQLLCLNPEASLAERDRIVWEVSVEHPTGLGSRLTGIPDLDGDGLEEIALGTQVGTVRIYSRAAGGLLHELEVPREAYTEGRRPPLVVGEILSIPGSDEAVRLFALVESGWLVQWAVTAESARSLPGHRISSFLRDLSVSPIEVDLERITPQRSGPAILALSGDLVLLEVPPDPDAPLGLVWGSWSCGGACRRGTPALVHGDDASWVVFTTPEREVVKLRLELPRRAAVPRRLRRASAQAHQDPD